jgi:hypothetical protein
MLFVEDHISRSLSDYLIETLPAAIMKELQDPVLTVPEILTNIMDSAEKNSHTRPGAETDPGSAASVVIGIVDRRPKSSIKKQKEPLNRRTSLAQEDVPSEVESMDSPSLERALPEPTFPVLYIASVGISPVMLIRSGHVLQIAGDHDPGMPHEQVRTIL